MIASARRTTSRSSIGEMLVAACLISDEQLNRARAIAMRDGRKLEDILVEQGFIDPQQLVMLISLHTGIPFVNLKKQPIKAKAVELVPESVAKKHSVVPLDVTDDVIVVAMEDPTNVEAIDDLAAITRKRIEPVLSIPSDIQRAIGRSYRSGVEIEKQLSQIPNRSLQPGLTEARVTSDATAHAPIVRAIDLLVKQAIRDKASDIHIEPQEDNLRVRYRIDGILHDALSLPLNIHAALVSRLKIMAGMNIAERRRPQDGQIAFPLEDQEVDIRVATAGTINGEMMVMRVLDKSFALMSLPELGFLPEGLEQYQAMLKMPFGMILTSGPTGSGKTTTLYASLNRLDSIGRNIITIEDPIEYRFRNINQIQVHPQAGITFATGLRACMRLDPDVILVGEIRDAETAKIAVQASLTGHLVLSSVHANDTAGVMFRLIDLGADPFLVAQATVSIVAQRMVRRVCPHCAQPVPAAPEERSAYENEMGEEKDEFLYGSGCNFCANTGYLGRMGIYEVMIVSDTIRRMVLSNASADDIRDQAFKEGMVSLWRCGMMKVQQGYTTPYEVLRIVLSSG
ncbi:GspE/PulE family protein [Chloroflexota bacterium]